MIIIPAFAMNTGIDFECLSSKFAGCDAASTSWTLAGFWAHGLHRLFHQVLLVLHCSLVCIEHLTPGGTSSRTMLFGPTGCELLSAKPEETAGDFSR